MTLTALKSLLQARPELNVKIRLPDGGYIPAHYHITEVGHVVKRFIDCGGTVRASESCVLQTFLGSVKDDGHRLTAGKLAHILDLASPLLASDELPVEVEYEEGVISQFPLIDVEAADESLMLYLALKHTDCLAKDRCGIGAESDVGESEGCCAGAAATGGCC